MRAGRALGEAFVGVQRVGPLAEYFVFGGLKMDNFRPFFSLNSLIIHHKLQEKSI